MDLADALLDNPILIKHIRSRLRPTQVIPWIAILAVLGACIVYAGHHASWLFGDPAAIKTLIGLQIFMLAFGGSNQINLSLGGARESGILDFHRVTPIPPWVDTLGFLLGAPIREYVLAGVLVPFLFLSASLVDVGDSWAGIRIVAQIEFGLVVSIWVIHAMTLLGVLTRKKPRGSVLGGIATVVFLLFLLYLGSIGIYVGTDWLFETDRSVNFFGKKIPWLVWLLIHEIPVLGFLGLAVTRKMSGERTHAYSKRQALACLATLSTLLIGTDWNVARLFTHVVPYEPTPPDMVMIGSIYAMSFMGIVLALAITPDLGEYIKGVRRAGRVGGKRPSPWSDAGCNRLVLVALCAILLIGASVVVGIVGHQGVRPQATWSYAYMSVPPRMTDREWLASRQSVMSRPIVVGVLTLAYVGLAQQYFLLRTRRSGMTLLSLFLFLTWLLPLAIGASVGTARNDQWLTAPIMALSPITGLALSSGLGGREGIDLIRIAALGPPITFAFVFNFLLVAAQRKVDHLVHSSEKAKVSEESVTPAVINATP